MDCKGNFITFHTFTRGSGVGTIKEQASTKVREARNNGADCGLE